VELSLRSACILAMLAAFLVVVPALAQQPAAEERSQGQFGDRVRSALGPQAAALDAAALAAVRLSPDYRIGAGDILTVRVRGKVDLHYENRSTPAQAGQESAAPDAYEVMPDGLVHLPLIGAVQAAGSTVAELRKVVTDRLSAYFKHFTVDLSVSKPGIIKVWVSGQVANPGPQALPSTATILEALLRADIQPTGSTRLVRLTRGGKTRVIDVYSIVARGELEANVTLEAGDEIYVPASVDWVSVTGEVCRPGQFEMVPPHQSAHSRCAVSDLINLCLGLLPTAAASNAVIERPISGGEVKAIHIDLTSKDDPELQPGDKLIVPSIADYQPTVRLVGEFKGEGVYQRIPGGALSKSGVYRLAKGETAGDVITRTGGTTPQADLTRATIERRKNGKTEILPLDLDRLLTRQDKSADVALESGDTIVLPALLDKVYVFGQVVQPGGIAYEPDRRLLDYLGRAGGMTTRAKSSVIVVRGSTDRPEILRVNVTAGIRGQRKENPLMQAGDVVFVPERPIADWRDIAQIISTVRLLTLGRF